MVTDCHSILARWKNHFYRLLNVHGVNDVTQTKIHTVEPLVLEPSAFMKLKRHKSPCIDKIPTEFFKAGVGQFVQRSIHLLIFFAIRRNCLRSGAVQSLYLFIGRVIKQTAVITEEYHFCLLHKKFYPTSCCQG